MYIDLLPINGIYRGISGMSRNLGATKISTKKWNKYFVIYEKYLDWLSRQDNSYSRAVLEMLIALRDEQIKRGATCEITFYSDKPEEFHFGDGFLGFDVYWVEEGISGIEEIKYVDVLYRKKLNDYGLFNTYEDAQDFRDAWKMNIDLNDPSPWVLDTIPIIYCVWSYQD